MNNPTFDLTNKVAIVTGSTKGIGRGIAEGLAKAGANLVIVSRNHVDCNQVAEEIKKFGHDALAVATDVTNLKAIDELVKKVTEHYGKIDILVNNAGSAITKKAEDLTEVDWDRVLNVDLKGV
ncbi:SDR family NAD(P)-dependent oxidoreductase, partial [Desulfosporosinus sp. I2]|uniref:SDR family NAD(P)-dependent oxidoreductase n=1 Tax=Desulfosporosinus sp. I2 TaxID=1617025 RepID=UPI0005F068A9